MKRIIPCLDFKDDRVVKGVKFQKMQDVGNPIYFAKRYEKDGADELVFLDISASVENRPICLEMVEKLADEIKIPLIVGGGIGSLKTIEQCLGLGATAVSINTAAVENPDLIRQASKEFDEDKIVVAIDTRRDKNMWVVLTKGSQNTEKDAVEWARQVEDLGAGQILLTSWDADGTKKGYNIEIIRKVVDSVDIPVIASGGAGSLEDILKVFLEGKADAALIASLFHFGTYTIREVKKFLASRGVDVR